jgi:hypothetical protein
LLVKLNAHHRTTYKEEIAAISVIPTISGKHSGRQIIDPKIIPKIGQ